MPSRVDPIDPKQVIPDEQVRPDVTALVTKINARLSAPWQENEKRCGRGFVLPSETTQAALEELMQVYSKWDVKATADRRGFVLTFNLPSSD